MIIISYATASHRHFQKRLETQATALGFTHLGYSDKWLMNSRWYPANLRLFSAPRGAGYWAWKPLIFLDALEKFPSETVLYLDASTVLLENPSSLIEGVNFVTVQTSFKNSAYTKRDCFYYMGCDREEYYNCSQVWAGVVAASKKAVDVIWEWAKYCLDARCVSDEPNVCGLENLSDFVDHRHDQSILSNLVAKYGLDTITTTIFQDN